MEKVRGMNSATPMVAVRPGRAPIMAPTTEPITIHIRLIGCSTFKKLSSIGFTSFRSQGFA